MAVAAPAEHPHRVDRGHHEPGCHVDGDQEVPELVAECTGEKRLEDVDIDDAPRVDGDATGRVHPRVGRQHAERTQEPGRRKGQADQEVGSRAQAIPAVEVDADEDRLHEEGKAFDGEAEAKRGAEAAHHPRPQDPELER